MATVSCRAGPFAAGQAALVLALICVLVTMTSAQAGSSYLAVWSSDKEKQDSSANTDFLAILDADPRSSTYGKVVNTASLQRVPGKNLLNELGLTEALGLTAKYNLPKSGIPSNVLNEAHHMSHEPIAVGRHRYLYLGGLISANVFRCDVADPLAIPDCALVTSASDVASFSGIDDFAHLPNGNLLVTYMGAKNLTTPGGLVELRLDGSVVGEYHAARRGGPNRYLPSVNGVRDTGLLAHPHGLAVRPDLNLVVTGDYAAPLSLATAESVASGTQDLGTTVRFWRLSNLKAGPTAIAQLPVGKGREKLATNNAPEGVMSVALTNRRKHKGVFAATMGGGSIWYAPDATVPNPRFRLVYRVGPGAAAAVFTITPDDRYLIQPIQGTWAPSDPIFNRDYPGEHRRRVIVLDIQKLLAAGEGVECAAPPVRTDADGTIQRITARNNGAPDCPTVTGEVGLNSRENFDTRGGPHFLAFDHETRRVAVVNYFVQLTPFNLPGSHMAGDDRVCMARLTTKGDLVLDRAFKDELTGEPCAAMDRPRSYLWPNHGRTGAAKPHAVTFIDTGWGEEE
ncbi:MAG: hypothetical protein AB7I59_27085 [Geminicoccaceae bacterium]